MPRSSNNTTELFSTPTLSSEKYTWWANVLLLRCNLAVCKFFFVNGWTLHYTGFGASFDKVKLNLGSLQTSWRKSFWEVFQAYLVGFQIVHFEKRLILKVGGFCSIMGCDIFHSFHKTKQFHLILPFQYPTWK